MLEHQTRENIKHNIKDSNVWVRLLFMILFAILYSAAEVVIAAVVMYQFVSLLISGKKNEKVLAFGGQLATYVYQVFNFLTFNTEDKPFPMGNWPSSAQLVAEEVQVATDDGQQVVEPEVELPEQPAEQPQEVLDTDAKPNS
ncbi:MAG: DUF4389 domain-containing protein [Ghiorsea sp.]